MARINVSNNTGMPMYVGSTMIPPGDSRDFDERDVPEHLKPQTAAPDSAPDAPLVDPIAELRTQTVDAIKSVLGQLDGDQLTALEAAEQADETPRKTLLEAITAERLRRAGQ